MGLKAEILAQCPRPGQDAAACFSVLLPCFAPGISSLCCTLVWGMSVRRGPLDVLACQRS